MLESVFEHTLPGNPGMRERERIVGNVSNKRSYARLMQECLQLPYLQWVKNGNDSIFHQRANG